MISTQHLQLKLGGNKVLNDISIHFPESAVTALIGPNGAGKSTLLHTVSRLQRQDSGSVFLKDRNIQGIAHDELARHMSVLRQENRIGSRLRVRDLVAFGRYPHNKGYRTADDEVIVDQVLEDFELETLSDRFLDTLSGGQRQRALLAMNFAQNTDLVLLDEPLNNLDLSHARHLMQIIRKHADKGRTFVLVLHDLNYAARYADHIIAMKQGQIFSAGDKESVFNAPLLSELYNTPIRITEIEGSLLALSY